MKVRRMRRSEREDEIRPAGRGRGWTTVDEPREREGGRPRRTRVSTGRCAGPAADHDDREGRSCRRTMEDVTCPTTCSCPMACMLTRIVLH